MWWRGDAYFRISIKGKTLGPISRGFLCILKFYKVYFKDEITERQIRVRY